MDIIFESLFSNGINAGYAIIAIACALLSGVLASWIASFRLRSSRSLFITSSLVPAITALVFIIIDLFLTSAAATTARLITAAIAFGLIRFRSAPGKADEMMLLFLSTAIGFVFGMGYLAYGFLAAIGFTLIYVLLTFLPIFEHKSITSEKLLKITVPESLNYTEMFDETFAHYLKSNALVEVKTTNMGSLFRLSYRIRLKNSSEEKEFIDELRIKNGNLEISVLPYVDTRSTL